VMKMRSVILSSTNSSGLKAFADDFGGSYAL
jgi:hypothetical protein